MKKNSKNKKEIIAVKEKNPVYLKLEYDEAIKSKKDLLLSELSLLTLLKTIEKYNVLRSEELKLKFNMYKAFKELNMLMRKTKVTFPFLEIPERLNRKETTKIKSIEETKPVRIFNEDLESQLRDIQERLKSIGKY
jgi:hypothetical protein